MARTPYASDVTDEQWRIVEPMIPPERPGGRHRTTDMREVLNGINYLVRTGCGWRSIPHDLPNWHTVRHYYDRFRADGTWERVHGAMRERVRVAAGRQPTPSAAVVDTRSVKAAPGKGGRRGRRGTTRARR